MFESRIEAHLKGARALWEMGREREGEALNLRGLELAPGHTNLINMRFNYLNSRQRFDEAIEFGAVALRHLTGEERSKVLVQRAYLIAARGDPARGLDEIATLPAREQRVDYVLLYRGMIHAIAFDFVAARADLAELSALAAAKPDSRHMVDRLEEVIRHEESAARRKKP